MDPTIREVGRVLKILLLVFSGFIFYAFIPMVLLCAFFWKLSMYLKNTRIRTIAKSLSLAACLAPTLYGHAGFVPAIAVVLVIAESPEEKWKLGYVPLLVSTIIALVAVPIYERYKQAQRCRGGSIGLPNQAL